MIAVAIPRCEASVIDNGRGRVRRRRGGGRRMHVWRIGRADPSLFRAAKRREISRHDTYSRRNRAEGPVSLTRPSRKCPLPYPAQAATAAAAIPHELELAGCEGRDGRSGGVAD